MNKKMSELLKVNATFYEAFAAGDFHALTNVMAKTENISVIHPGSSVIHGRDNVLTSWKDILKNSGGSSILCKNPTPYVHGDTAYVICNEVFPEGQLIATNIFIMENGKWRMVHHQAAPGNQSVRAMTETSKSLH